ncbi:hypothetical protein ACFV4P_12040 [Kitasatospora sp. NPDC059795]|uniref:hypothetical protein n=1 Tax=Kitasatospora sp. NPDC059795 TaxID=3346949 RepID=UPI003658B2ED
MAATAATLLPTSAGAADLGRPGVAADPNPNFAVDRATAGGGVQQTESWLFKPAPSTDGRSVSATHRTSYRGCTGSAKSTLNQNAPVTWNSSCTDPFPDSTTETVTYTWDTGDTTTVNFDKVAVTKEAGGNVIRFRMQSTGTVTAGSGAGKAVTRNTLFDPVGSGCDKDSTEVFGVTADFTIG